MANQVSGMAGYYYYRSTDGGATFTQLNATPLPEGTSYEVLNLDPNTDYSGQLYWAPVDKQGLVGAKKSYAADGLLVKTANPTPADAPMAADKVAAIDAIVAKCIAAGAGPSVMVGVIHPQYGYLYKAYGAAGGAGVNLHFRLASQTKSFIGHLLLRCAEQELLSLDDHPADHGITGLPNGSVMTLKQMAMMRSGIFDYSLATPGLLGMFGLNLGAQFTLTPTMAYTVNQIIADIKAGGAMSTPGSTYYYTNANYYILARVIEAVDPAGRTIDKIIQQDLLTPLGMVNTYMQLATGGLASPYSPGYDNGPLGAGLFGRRDVTSQNPSFTWAAGAMVSTLPDMIKWAKELRDGTLLSPESQQLRMTEFGIVPLSGQARYGLDWRGPTEFGYGIAFINVGSLFGIDGSWLGHDSFSGFEPSTGTVISVYENFQTGPPHTLHSLSTISYEIMEYLMPGSASQPGYGTGQDVSGTAAAVMEKMSSAGNGNIYLPGQFQPFNEINVARTAQPVPVNASGVYVTLIGAGNKGGNGTAAYNASGGAGGGGGGRVNRVRIPRALLGDTYSTSFGINGVDSIFASGGITLTAEGGAAGRGAVGGGTAAGGAGGNWSAVPAVIDGVTVTGAKGTNGGNSNWQQVGGSDGGSDSTNDVGCGGGGGRCSYGGISGRQGRGGSSLTMPGGTGPGTNAPPPDDTIPPTAHGGPGGGEGQPGGAYGGGGGGGYSYGNVRNQAGGAGAQGLVLLEWF